MNKTQPSKKLVPQQEEGSKSDTSHSITLKTKQEAVELFSMAKNRLLDMSNWDKLCGLVTGKFHLTDNRGNEIKGLAITGDYLKIDIPGPGTKTGNGYDWVRIEAIDEDSPGPDCEEIAIRVRPSPNPGTHNPEARTAHFLKIMLPVHLLSSVNKKLSLQKCMEGMNLPTLTWISRWML